MMKRWRILLLVTCFLGRGNLWAQNNSESALLIQWRTLSSQPLTEQTFEKSCDLMQEIANTDFSKSYSLFQEFIPRVRSMHNQRWMHILLMGWARAKESLNYFADAEALFSQARLNADGNPSYYRESLVGTILLYLEWGKKDSLDKYIQLSTRACLDAHDSENLSFTYTFKAMSMVNRQDSVKYYLTRAIGLARPLTDKNALFTARYNYAVVYCQSDPLLEEEELDSLLPLAEDTTLNLYPPRLYTRTNFSFRNAKSSVYYNLMQVDLLLTDYDNAAHFAQLFYDAVISRNPHGVQVPYFDAEMSIVKSYQKDFISARQYLTQSFQGFHMAEDKIPYISYFIAAGLLKEHDHQYTTALSDFRTALEKGNTEGLYIMPPEIYYAQALIQTGYLLKAEEVLHTLSHRLQASQYNATGYYYYKDLSELWKARHNYPKMVNTLDTFYLIKDSLTSLKRYRAIEELQTKFNIREEQQKIAHLQSERTLRIASTRKARIFYVSIISLTLIIILLLATVFYFRQVRNRQELDLQTSKIRHLEEAHRIAEIKGVMEAEENERRKIADQLHDEVGSLLSLASLHISSLTVSHTEDAIEEKKLGKVREILSSVSAIVRDLSHRLTPMAIEQYGFKNAVEDLAETINLSGKLSLETVLIGFEDTKKYEVSILNHLYRIIQELLNNIIKHAHASHAILELVEHQKGISLIIEDNGQGIPSQMKGKGHGLQSIQTKITYLKGSFEINSKKEGGTLIVVELPV